MNPTRTDTQVTDIIDPARIAALNATLGVDGDDPKPFAHQVFFWDARPAAALGPDGHPKVGGLIPDFGLPRRMWAGGRLTFSAPLRLGQPATKTTSLLRADRKTGRSGALGLVTLRHEISQAGQLIITDEQDLIYRDAANPAAPAPQTANAPMDESLKVTRSFTTTELFRYSALTFNGHRIHYDRNYAKQAEGYPGLVVHGPLLAQYLMLMAEQELGTLRSFEFRATAPVFDFETVDLCAKPSPDGLAMWVRAEDGRLCMTASAQ